MVKKKDPFYIGFGEPNLEKRTIEAKLKASRIYNNKSESEEEAFYSLRFILCGYKPALKGIFDKYFDNLTIDDLILEIELERLCRTSSEQKMEDIVKNESNKEELSGMFDDWVDELKPKENTNKPNQWVDVKNKMSEDEFNDIANKFMESGDFIEKDKK